MISALQKAYPRLAALLGSRDNASPETNEPPDTTSEPVAAKGKPAAGSVWTHGRVDSATFGAQPEVQRAMHQFYEVAPERITELRSLFGQISATPQGSARDAILTRLRSHLRVLLSITGAPGLESVFKLTKALDRLIEDISQQPSALTHSTLRTTASSIVLLESLSKRGLETDLANPAPVFLCIDDDAVCLRAICSALEQAFPAPAQAVDGESALALAQQQTYDVIFLDVEMPGMNGFEVCKQIHQIKLNQQTPVVFVTVHSDFDSRAKGSESSGHDLIAKPFLPCELTLKTLTLLARRRMQRITSEPN